MANLNITVVEKRMLRPSEAASYSGLPLKHFRTECPVQPIELRPGVLLYDKRDLDQWIDGLKDGIAEISHAEILGRLS